MNDPSDPPSLADHLRSWVRDKAPSWVHKSGSTNSIPDRATPLTLRSPPQTEAGLSDRSVPSRTSIRNVGLHAHTDHAVGLPVGDQRVDLDAPQTTPPPLFDAGLGETTSAMTSEKPEPAVVVRFYHTARTILLSSWLNLLLVAVPIGIAVRFAHLNPVIVFVVNAIAIIPLAGLLSYATESVARKMGDTVGALMNVTFGNAVELIIL